MKVIHIDTGKEWRGGQSQVLMLAEGMRARGHDVMIAARKGSPLAERALQLSLECYEVPFRFEADPAAALMLAQMGNGSASLFHAHTPHALGLSILSQALRPQRPILFTRRVDFPIKKFFLNRWKLNRADCIVAVSRAVRAVLVQAGIPEQKIRVIYSAVDSRVFRYHGPKVNDPLELVVSAAIEPSKGIKEAMLCVEKATSLPVRFHFIGTGSRLKELLRWAKGRANVEVHGFVKDVPAFLKQMFGAVSFSKSEGFPNAILQAMAVGLPVLARDIEPVREVLVDENFGTLFHTTDEAVAGIASWVSRKQAAAENTRRASEWVLSNFSHDSMVEQTLDLYKEMVS